MRTYFECKIKHVVIGENGLDKKVVFTAIIDAFTWSQAELRFMNLCGENGIDVSDYEINIKLVKYQGIYPMTDSETEKYFKVIVEMLVSENGDKEKRERLNYFFI